MNTGTARADHLDADHQGQRQRESPQRCIAISRTNLLVGRNATRVVVCSARNQACTQPADDGILGFGQFGRIVQREVHRQALITALCKR